MWLLHGSGLTRQFFFKIPKSECNEFSLAYNVTEAEFVYLELWCVEYVKQNCRKWKSSQIYICFVSYI
jgi:hypothetical protein